MVRFIKLTDIANNSTMYISCKHIIGFMVHDNKTYISLEGYDDTIEVKETPEEILRLIAECED